ncbi:phosphodiester glycosidase family protein [Methylorubrum extorquens]|uniref:phosphodiester glycosidase family protein n=1 Tax=Methylorubrum extorquens TaxID=408 RepID=UPI001EE515E7|nr:phosphodiester glycosidase family protein [Methylorubrum extorquens]MCG5249056.1 phosphodiester glycosidase family protein [Methylorubrum extorquens]
MEKIELDPGKFLNLFTLLSKNTRVAVLTAKTIKVGDQSVKGLFIDDYFEISRAKLVISGGYMSSFSPPIALGYLRVGGRQINPLHKSWITSGYFCTTGTEWTIEPATKELPPTRYKDCLQAGPLFIDEGVDRYVLGGTISVNERKLAESEQIQAFVCSNKNGQLLFGVVDEIRLDKLSKWLVERGKCHSALRLSGSTSAGLRVKDQLFGSNDLPLTDAIAVLPK